MTMQRSRKTVREQLLEGRPPNRNPQHRRHVMSKQLTRRRANRTLAVGVAVAVLVGIVGAGQALAAVAAPDERVLERQGMIDRQAALGQQERSGRAPAGTPLRFIRPEPPVGPGPQLGDQRMAPGPVRKGPGGARGGLVVIVVVALLLAVGATTTWRVRHRRPQPESTA
jgi:hypothetical protein